MKNSEFIKVAARGDQVMKLVKSLLNRSTNAVPANQGFAQESLNSLGRTLHATGNKQEMLQSLKTPGFMGHATINKLPTPRGYYGMTGVGDRRDAAAEVIKMIRKGQV